MYYGYCLMPAPLLQWTPKITLATAEESYRYCGLHHVMFPEVLITDEDDFTVMVASRHILYIVFPGNVARRFDLRTGPDGTLIGTRLADIACDAIPRVMDERGNLHTRN